MHHINHIIEVTNMGTSNSKNLSGGMLIGAYAPPLQDVSIPAAPAKAQTFQIKVTHACKVGDPIPIQIHGQLKDAKAPQDLSPGKTFIYTEPPNIESHCFNITLRAWHGSCTSKTNHLR